MTRLVNKFLVILFAILFFALSTGIVITMHECCHKHQHTKTEHNHCNETKIVLKIEEDFIFENKSNTLDFPSRFVSDNSSFGFQISRYKMQGSRCKVQGVLIPPLLKFVGANFLKQTSQRVFYS